MNDMLVNVICEGRKGSTKNPAAMTIVLGLPNNMGRYSRSMWMSSIPTNSKSGISAA